ncbi:uncharacterized protein Z518_08270 [Rhinocladiella mackenziei CBS 650.93]|uniref:Hypervirulence associated protein TUDOR domain-containing protein n=1 Tax=Rhinocladiella mackenziei CBS 650.93 TaxID=1442369 RepID=A0A0D2I912_9EURO|nr:uncharacterized protein Z518_08270 [Rhinocladiella mackenziei CBS 650.93]KIX02329.1 hypothetical protein Z518_08270 [Rhinocladiella mackenziei CBS 650.93]
MSEIKSKGGSPIEEGDTVATPYRGGKHEGKVEQIITDEEEARKLDAKGASHAPAVVFTDQNDKKVVHKPETVRDVDKEG